MIVALACLVALAAAQVTPPIPIVRQVMEQDGAGNFQTR